MTPRKLFELEAVFKSVQKKKIEIERKIVIITQLSQSMVGTVM